MKIVHEVGLHREVKRKKSAVSFIYILLVVIWIITVALYLKDSPKCKLLFLS